MERVEALRHQRWTGRQIAAELDISPATVSRILKRLGLNRLAALEQAEPVRRHERDTPGDLVANGAPKTRRPGAGPGLQGIARIALFLVAGTRSHLNLLFDAPGLAT